MPKAGDEIYLTPLEVEILAAFIRHLYMTDQEMAYTMRVLADKLDNKKIANG